MGKFIVKYYKIILILALAALIPALIGMMNTRVNYDKTNFKRSFKRVLSL